MASSADPVTRSGESGDPDGETGDRDNNDNGTGEGRGPEAPEEPPAQRTRKRTQRVLNDDEAIVLLTSTSGESTYPGRTTIDLTASGNFKKFSSSFAHGGIPVPFVEGNLTSESVEGLWQGLKVFENESYDASKFRNNKAKNLKRKVTMSRGNVKGHYAGEGKPLLDYNQARLEIFLPAYVWVMENRLQPEIADLERRLRNGERFVIREQGVKKVKVTDEDATSASVGAILKEVLEERLGNATV